MKLTEEQIEKIIQLREELRIKIIAFNYGVTYGMKIFTDEGVCIVIWPRELIQRINDFKLENQMIGNKNITELNAMEVNKCLEEYFQTIYNIIINASGEVRTYLSRLIDEYINNVKKVLNY